MISEVAISVVAISTMRSMFICLEAYVVHGIAHLICICTYVSINI
jgi:hypothetical protein